MNRSHKRYTPNMLHALSAQSLRSLALNAVTRGVVFTLAIQLIAFASSGRISGLLQMALLAFIFSLLVFSFDLIEKYWAQSKLKKSS